MQDLIAAIVAGIMYALMGYAKEHEKNPTVTQFKWDKLIVNIVICGLVGGYAEYVDAEFSVLITGAVGIGVTKFVKLGYKIVTGWMSK